MVDLGSIRSRTVTASEYIQSLADSDKQGFLDVYEDYQLDMGAVEALRVFVKDITIVVFSASWCKDCRHSLPIFAHLEDKMGLDVRVFGAVKTAPLDPKHKWAIPPSPPEIEEWKVTAIPWIEIFDKQGKKVGTIIEKPTVTDSIEEELIHVLNEHKHRTKKPETRRKS